jgi:membrane associated rhomboid family serine protease
MDWSLVLLSQGIESTIESPESGSGWGLRVQSRDHEPALKAIRQYHLENRAWPWQQRLLRPGLVFDWGSLAWALLLLVFYGLDAQRGLQSVGLMDSVAVSHGHWWRLFTAVWLHADLAHLGTNATIGLALLGLAMGRHGTGPGLLAAYLSGVSGNVAGWLLAAEPHRSLGASGMVMGSLGLLAAQSFSPRRQSPQATRHLVSGVLGGIMLFVLLALTPGTDIVAHTGGFLSGLLLGGALALASASIQEGWVNLAAGAAFAILVILPWWLAFRA